MVVYSGALLIPSMCVLASHDASYGRNKVSGAKIYLTMVREIRTELVISAGLAQLSKSLFGASECQDFRHWACAQDAVPHVAKSITVTLGIQVLNYYDAVRVSGGIRCNGLRPRALFWWAPPG